MTPGTPTTPDHKSVLNQSVKLGKTSGYPPPTVPALRAQRNGPHGTFPSSAGYCIRARPSAWEVTGLLSLCCQPLVAQLLHKLDPYVGDAKCVYSRFSAAV